MQKLVTDQITVSVGYDKENIKTDYTGEIKDGRYDERFQNMLMELSI